MRDDRVGVARGVLVAGVFAACFAGALGCGNVQPPGTGIPIDMAPREIAESVCPKAYSCCTASQLMGNDMAGVDEPSCELRTADNFRSELTAVQTSQRDGRSRYDGDKLTTCLAYVRASSCETLGQTNHFSGIPGCDNFVMPLVQDGGPCVNNWECTGSLCTDGRCAELPTTGAACTSDMRCAAGDVCASGICFALLADGANCVAPIQCPSGACVDGTCTPRTPTCFYASGCSVAGGGAGASLAAIAAALVMVALGARRRRVARGA